MEADLGLEVKGERLRDHSNYLRSWIKLLQEDPNELFRVCQSAEKISNYIMENYEEYIKKEPLKELKNHMEIVENSGIPRQSWRYELGVDKTMQRMFQSRLPEEFSQVDVLKHMLISGEITDQIIREINQPEYQYQSEKIVPALSEGEKAIIDEAAEYDMTPEEFYEKVSSHPMKKHSQDLTNLVNGVILALEQGNGFSEQKVLEKTSVIEEDLDMEL